MELQRDTETETVHVDNRLFFWVRCEFICVTHVAPSEKINKQLKERKKTAPPLKEMCDWKIKSTSKRGKSLAKTEGEREKKEDTRTKIN